MKKIQITQLLAGGLLLAALLFNGCSSMGNYSHKEGIDYSKYKTYSLIPIDEGTIKLNRQLDIFDEVIYQEIDKELAAKNFTKAAEGAEPDFLVRVSFTRKRDVNPAARLNWAPNEVNDTPDTIDVGYLVIDVIIQDIVAYSGYTPSGQNMDTLSAVSARQMVYWCLQGFPPPYKLPPQPKITPVKE